MCASSIDDVPRGLEVLLSPNRINVAISRAQCLAVVVGSPTLLAARCRTLEQMRRLDLYCRLVAYAEQQAAGTPND
jgi:superfamily I DNA and/or RNA helicase